MKLTKKISFNLFALLALVFVSFEITAQEICNNGIDDDNDGFVDCYDADCQSQNDCDGFYYGGTDPTCEVNYVFDPEFGLNRVWKGVSQVNGNVPLTVADVDNDGVPEVVAARLGANEVYFIDGQTGQTEKIIPGMLNSFSQGVGVIDANGNGQKETYLVNANGILYGYKSDGVGIQNFQTQSVGYTSTHAIWHPQFADFDEDGTPEIYLGNQIFSTLTGEKLSEGGNSESMGAADGDQIDALKEHNNTFAADILPDDFCEYCEGVELICGNQVWSVGKNGNDWEMNLASSIENQGNYRDGKTSVADWDGDGDLDIIVSSVTNSTDGAIYIWNPRDTTLIGNSADGGSLASNPFNPNSLLTTSIFSSRLGVLMVADIDGDGFPEIGGVAKGAIFVLDHDLTELWSKSVNNRDGVNSMTAFDFEGDGNVEVVYQTEDSLLVLNAVNGEYRTSYPCPMAATSRLQMPIIADVTADGKANIVCSCGNAPVPTEVNVHVLNSVTNDWKPTRKFWNQFSFAPNTVNDDVQILREAQNTLNIQGHNVFLSQLPHLATNGDLLWLTENCDSVRLIVSEDGVNNDWLPQYGNVTPNTCVGEDNNNSLQLTYPSSKEEVVFKAYSATGIGDLTSLDFSIQSLDFNKEIRIKVVDTAGVVLVDTLFNVTTQNETISADLSAYQNSAHLIKSISLTAEDDANFCIDYIKFTKGSDVSVRKVSVNNVSYIVNENGVLVKSDVELIKEIRLFDTSGKLVNGIKANGKQVQINTAAIARGIYVIEVDFEDVLQQSHVKVSLR